MRESEPLARELESLRSDLATLQGAGAMLGGVAKNPANREAALDGALTSVSGVEAGLWETI